MSRNRIQPANEIEAARVQAARTVGIIYCLMAIVCALAALGFHWSGEIFGTAAPDARLIASAFVAIGALDIILLAVWERVFAFRT